jgi:hypothetical protein
MHAPFARHAQPQFSDMVGTKGFGWVEQLKLVEPGQRLYFPILSVRFYGKKFGLFSLVSFGRVQHEFSIY